MTCLHIFLKKKRREEMLANESSMCTQLKGGKWKSKFKPWQWEITFPTGTIKCRASTWKKSVKTIRWHHWNYPVTKIREYLRLVGWTPTESLMSFQALLDCFCFPCPARLAWLFTRMWFLMIVRVDSPPQSELKQERDWWR